MKKRKEKEFKIRTYLTGIIWLALACSMIISALLFAFLKHFLEMPENIPAIVWLLIFNTMIAGLITVLLNGHLQRRQPSALRFREIPRRPYRGSPSSRRAPSP